MKAIDLKAIALHLIALKDKDLKVRKALLEKSQLNEGYHPEMEKVHLTNSQELEKIYDEIGFPTISKVGDEANAATWLIVQHAISRPQFMIKSFELLKQAVINNDANPVNLAMLEDRILVFQGKTQKYGSAYDWDENGELSPLPFDDLNLVNERRKSLGLDSIEDRIVSMRLQAQKENHKAPKDFKNRRKESEEWRKRVGWI